MIKTRELSFAERRDWLRLIRTPTVGPVAFRDLLRRYKTAEAALDALPQIIKRKSIIQPTREDIEATHRRLYYQFGGELISCTNPVWQLSGLVMRRLSDNALPDILGPNWVKPVLRLFQV